MSATGPLNQPHPVPTLGCEKGEEKRPKSILDKTNNSKRFKKLDYLLMEKNRRDRSIESTSWWCQLLDGDRMPGLKKAYI